MSSNSAAWIVQAESHHIAHRRVDVHADGVAPESSPISELPGFVAGVNTRWHSKICLACVYITDRRLMAVSTKGEVRRRPKDRKEHIVQAARMLIGELGFHNVSMAQIADRVGVTAGALYRHFPNKAILLASVIDKSLDEVGSPNVDCGSELDEVLTKACTQVVARRDSAALWWRESRHLGPETHAPLQKRLWDNNQSYQALLRATGRTLSKVHAERLAWGVQAILASPGFHATKVPDEEFIALLSMACRAVCAVEFGPAPPQASEARRELTPVSVREAMLTKAAELFERNGFEATSLNDIGATVGVTGPNLYSYFESKGDILDAALTRGLNALWLLLHNILRSNDDPTGALRDLVQGYTQLALERTILTSTLLTEQHLISDPTQAQREYVAEWVALVRASRPDLDETSTRVLVHTALAVIHNMARIAQGQDDPGIANDIAAMAIAVLFAS